mgnify:CR=1 FL=1
MYTNELLEEKYKTQKELIEFAKDDQELYFELIEQFVSELYRDKKWNLVYSKRKGGYEEQTNPRKALR